MRNSARLTHPVVAAGGFAFCLAFVTLWAPPTPFADAPARSSGKAGLFTPTKEERAGLRIEPVSLRRFQPEQIAEGNIAANDDLTTPVFSPYSGRVVRLMAKLGDKVERGAPLFAVEATEFVQAVNDLIAAETASKTAHAQQSQAETSERRAHDLFTAKGGALKDWQQSQTDLVVARNNAHSADIALTAVRNRLRIFGNSDKDIAALETQTQKFDPVSIVTAPIAGVVTQRQIGLGQYIQSVAAGASNPVYTIGDFSTVWLVANIPESQAGAVRIGEAVGVTVPAYPGRVFAAKLTWIAPSIDKDTRRLPVRGEIDNTDGALKPWMFASFRITTGNTIEAPAVPQSAIVYEGDTARVWVARADGGLEGRSVTPGLSTGDGFVEIRQGLAAGEQVVTHGTLFIDRAGGAG
jgi:cobalt-zinc-cadmium efflux system membrane fusion protein